MSLSLIEPNQTQKDNMNKVVKKISNFGVYVALLKAYIAMAVLFMPGQTALGGYIFFPFTVFLSFVFTTICSLKLVQCGIKTKTFCYSTVTQICLGRKVKPLLEVMVWMI